MAESLRNNASIKDSMSSQSLEDVSILSSSKKHSFYQIWLMLVTFTSYFIIGMSVAWPNTLFSHLTVNNTTLLGTQINFSNSQLDWMGSCSYGGMAVMMIPGGWIAGRLGRRRSIIIGAFIHALGWLIVALAVNFNMIITGRVIIGGSIAVTVVGTRTYITEIASNNIRGIMTTTLDVMKALGYISVVALGMGTTWYYISFICMAGIFIYAIVALLVFPESPTYLLIQGKKEEAREIIVRLRGTKTGIEKELNELEF